MHISINYNVRECVDANLLAPQWFIEKITIPSMN
jgi:hypothetical protein